MEQRCFFVGAWTRHDRDPECVWQSRESDTWMQGHQVVGQLLCAFSHLVDSTRLIARTCTLVTDY